MPGSQQVTELLRSWRGGDQEALDELTPLVYRELKRLAQRAMRAENRGHTLQATALVHEAYVKLVEADVPWKDRAHFFAVAARVMRRILVDHARARRSEKRGGGQAAVTLEEGAIVGAASSAAMLDLDEALNRLAQRDERKASVVELHYFGGLTYDELAEALDVSAVTVHRDLKLAKAWLYSELRSVNE